jgi:gliding motility-associated-like protein
MHFFTVRKRIKQQQIHCCIGITFMCSLFCTVASFAQINTTGGLNAQQMVTSIMGKGYSVSNPKLTCPTGASGTFVSTTSNIGLGQGIVLTTGTLANVNGPNNQGAATGDNNAPGDADLDALEGEETKDACVLECDLVPSCDLFKIRYVFASEEYPQYVGSDFNDVFAFFISGPGITGVRNIATVPGTTTPVAINNVNANINSQYFVDNKNGQTVQYNGFTTPLTGSIKVVPCQTYHLKMAIADVKDGLFDSGVFIEAGSIDCPTAEIVSPPVCANAASVDLCAPAGYTYDWPAGQPGATGPLNQQCLKVNAPKAGDVYTVNLTAIGGGCPSVSKITLKGSDFSVRDTAVCPGSAKFPLTVTPLTNGKYDFKWEPATNLSCTDCQNPVFDPVSSQTYTITMSDKDVTNCNRIKTVKVTVGSSFTVTALGTEICEGETATITASGADTYIWQPGNLTGESVQVTPGTTTTYTVTGSKPNATCPGTANTTAVVTVRPKAIAAATDVTTCAGTAVKLTGVISGGANKGTWIGGSGIFSPDRNTLNAMYTPSIAEAVAGKAVLTLESEDPQGPCGKASKQLTVNITPAPIPLAGADQVICAGSTVQLNGSFGDSTAVGMWSGGKGTFTPNSLDPKAVYTPTKAEEAAGKVVLIFTASDPTATCPRVSDTMVVLFNQKVIVSAGDPTAICAGASIKLNGSVSGGANTGTWTGGTGTYIPGNSDLKAAYQPSPSEIAAGKVTLLLISNTTGACPTDSAEVTHTINPNPIILFSVDKSKDCPPHCVQFFDSTTAGSTTITNWEWDFGNGKTGQGKLPAKVCYDKAGVYDVKLKATSDKKCVSSITNVKMIETYKNPVAQFIADPNPASVFDPVIHFFDQSTKSVNKWNWDFGDGQVLFPGKHNPSHRYVTEEGETYVVKLVVADTNGCVDSTEQTVEIKSFYAFYMPNAFTPDANSVNDKFRGHGVGIAEYNVWIFDRWGNLVFEADDISKGWDGTVKGGNEIALQDVYVWKVKIKDIFGKKHNYTGTVTLVK